MHALPDLPAMIAQCTQQVPTGWMKAIIQNESGGNPLAINVNGGQALAHQPESIAQAQATAAWLYQHGYSFDAGIAQINSANFKRLNLDTKTVFDPCINIKAAAIIFDQNYRQSYAVTQNPQRAVLDAISMYNTGTRTLGFSNGYVRKIVDTATSNPNIIPLTGKEKQKQTPKEGQQKQKQPAPNDPYDVYNNASQPAHMKVY
ncbi:MAG TPA: lytic transglycosylase domain-containing protein [Thiomonas arsenitoxydans]|uniref:lytic transglycosylase domain-containing protein n=1 Tax=Thiomonas arsenitoxydans (strain DSM 22701 / CIP 110005 / 3As) TaxID=426114 RepID=UPI002BEB120C|nr:lytic transglycosylase domain-containing protein [Thiomonas arsenitoxydans]HML83090.1 lytic transglycosylase domain-containing protein [Thiomonas arsenitoxydans]